MGNGKNLVPYFIIYKIETAMPAKRITIAFSDAVNKTLVSVTAKNKKGCYLPEEVKALKQTAMPCLSELDAKKLADSIGYRFHPIQLF
jgi:hypothetical protein